MSHNIVRGCFVLEAMGFRIPTYSSKYWGSQGVDWRYVGGGGLCMGRGSWEKKSEAADFRNLHQTCIRILIKKRFLRLCETIRACSGWVLGHSAAQALMFLGLPYRKPAP